MFFSDNLHTTLTATQLTIGLLFGFAPVVFTILARRIRDWKAHESNAGARVENVDAEADAPVKEHRRVPRPLVDLNTLLRASYYALGVLSARRESTLFWTIVHEVQAVQKLHQDTAPLSPWEIGAALERLRSQGFIRSDCHDFAITGAGRALYARIGRLAGASILEGVQREPHDVTAPHPERPHAAHGESRTRVLPSRQRRRRPRLPSRR